MNRSQQTAFDFTETVMKARPKAPPPSPRVARTRPLRRPEPRFEARSGGAWPIDLRTGEPLIVAPEELERQYLERRIASYLVGARLALAVTDNRHTMISVKREKGLYRLRVHRMFLESGEDVVEALARYVDQNDREASMRLGHYIDLHQHRIRRGRHYEPPAVTIETRGEVHDLQALYDDINRSYFGGAISARITWGHRSPKNARRRRHNSIKMGSYSVEDRLIRIHPSLDRPFVPRHFVEWIVYHEMLHQKHDIPVVRGRRQFHTPAFLVEEASFEHYQRSRRWERENLNRILLY